MLWFGAKDTADLNAVNVPACHAIVRRRKERKLLRDAVECYVKAISTEGGSSIVRTVGRACSRGAPEEVDAVTCTIVYECRTAHDPDGDVGYVVVRPPAIREPGGITHKSAEPLLVFGKRWRNTKVKSKELSAGGSAIVPVQGLTRVLQQQAHEVGPWRRRDWEPEDEKERLSE